MESSTGSTETQGQQAPADSRNGGENGHKVGVGRVEEVAGVVIEAVFPDENLPEIYNALELDLTQSVSAGSPVTRGWSCRSTTSPESTLTTSSNRSSACLRRVATQTGGAHSISSVDVACGASSATSPIWLRLGHP